MDISIRASSQLAAHTFDPELSPPGASHLSARASDWPVWCSYILVCSSSSASRVDSAKHGWRLDRSAGVGCPGSFSNATWIWGQHGSYGLVFVRHAAAVRFRLRPIAAMRRLHPQLPATFPSFSRAPPRIISHSRKPCTHLLRPLADPEPPQKVLLGRWDRIRPEADHSPIKLLGEVQRPLGHAQIDMLQRDGHGRFIVPLRRCSLLPYGDYNLA